MKSGLRPIQRISRRGLISSGMFAGLLLASGLPVAAKGKGGTLRLSLLGAAASDSWDPRFHDGLFMQVAAQGAAFECLTEITAAGELVGELAEAWDCDPGGRVWTLSLREGGMFHDGQPVRAADVAASLLHHGPESSAWYITEQIEEALPLNDQVLRLTLKGGNADFPFLLADPHLIIAPAGDFARGIGSGPYRVEAFEAGRFARLSRVENHWRDGAGAFFSALELQSRQGVARLEGVDALGDVTFEESESLAGAQILVTSGYRKAVAVLPPEWMKRRAELARALPRSVFAGAGGAPSPDHPLSPLHLHVRRDLPAEDPSLLLQLAAEGFDIAALDWQVFEAGFTADAALSQALAAHGPLALLSQDIEIIEGIKKARASFDSATRAQLYGALQERIMRDGPALWPATLPVIDAHRPELMHGPQTSGLMALDGARIAKRWWFA